MAAVIDAPRAVRAPVPEPGRDPRRWARFEAAVLAAGVSRERLFEAFPDVEDIEDIVRTPDADLAACAATFVRSLLDDRAVSEPALAPVRAAVRCADCHHFDRAATHPRLGRCGAEEKASAAGGWWDTQRRDCAAFVPIHPA